ncbi:MULTISPECIES: hypothetical protein [unclassified Pseudoalteromonas]|jgi:hypothetical protein|uniref:hypothetical protein n=1 Tax=unclassified Pseudoalteromonas TaxID=194690 RepID=UPI0004902B60|nr:MULTISPECIES: hypothetical protein [unclassified Pseudoalteromonas]|tara:strand:+ start:25 stop:417 length:393 start_codon:yes stop_codon:yes gene_type:complete
MKNTKSQFIRQYVRASRSPWDDCSTILLLADVVNEQAMELNFNHYIYLHRDSVGNVLGISISNSMLEKNPSFESRYLEGVDMTLFLLIYIEQITQFCELFSEEFQQIFMQTPTTFFAAAENDWVDIIDNA